MTRRRLRSCEFPKSTATVSCPRWARPSITRKKGRDIEQTYHSDLPERRVRDYDNLEVKQYLDAVAAWLLIDDGGLLCDVHHTTELGEADCTRMFIMDSSRFPSWLAERGMKLQDVPDG